MAQYRALTQLLQAAPMFLVNPPEVTFQCRQAAARRLAGAGGRLPHPSLLRHPLFRAGPRLRRLPPLGRDLQGASGTKTWRGPHDADRDDGRLALLGECPVLFQERIVGPDVRVHVVGERIFKS
jgi:hypothetical protein